MIVGAGLDQSEALLLLPLVTLDEELLFVFVSWQLSKPLGTLSLDLSKKSNMFFNKWFHESRWSVFNVAWRGDNHF